MKLRLLAYKDNRVGVFRNPFVYDKDNEELVIDLKSSFKNIKVEAAEQLKDNSLYELGVFDNHSGEIVPTNVFILDAYPIARSMIEEVKTDVNIHTEEENKQRA